MQYPTELVTGRLIKRYKRFLADIKLDTGELITAHCANTGSMKNCQPDNAKVWLWDSKNPKRKLPYSWEWVEIDGQHKACINTARANQLVKEALLAGVIESLGEVAEDHLKAEPKVDEGRLDFLISTSENSSDDIYIEVKNVTLLAEDGSGLGYFPDAVSARGLKHLQVLQRLKQQGQRAILLFCVAHQGIQKVRPATHVDPAYSAELSKAVANGVEVLAYQTEFLADEIVLKHRLPVEIEAS